MMTPQRQRETSDAPNFVPPGSASLNWANAQLATPKTTTRQPINQRAGMKIALRRTVGQHQCLLVF